MAAENITVPQFPTRTVTKSSIDAVEQWVHQLCRRFAERLTFHGWHHVSFVRSKAVEFANANGAEVGVVETAALVHDVNYIVRRNSSASAGRGLRLEILSGAGVPRPTAGWVDRVIIYLADEYGPALAAAINEISVRLTTEDLIAWNVATDIGKEEPADVATAWLEDQGLL